MGLVKKMDKLLSQIPGIAYAVSSTINHDLPEIAANRTFVKMKSLKERCEAWSGSEEDDAARPTSTASDDRHDRRKPPNGASGKAKKKTFMGGYPQTTLILNRVPEKDDLDLDPEYLALKVLDHSHMDHNYKLESSVDPDFVQKRAGFSVAAEHIDVKIPKSGAITEAEEKAEAAQEGVEEAKSDADKAKAQARLTKAEDALRAVRKRVCQKELGVAEWGDDKVGGRGYGVVVRLVKEGSPAYSAGVKKTMAATSVNKTVVKVHSYFNH